jgi:uncharacterized YccA/Bax inhibitor family protein
VKSSNPVLSRLGQAADRDRTSGYGAYGPGYDQPYPTAPGYSAAPPAVQPMTIDDVVVKTVTLLGLTGISAVLAWTLIPEAATGIAWIGAALVGLVLGFIISFSRMANPALVVAYAVIEGVFVGMVSKAFSQKGYATFNDAPTATAGQLEDMYAAPAATGVDTGRMTIDDVVVKTGLMFGVLLPLAAAAYFLNNPVLTFGGAIAGLVLGLVVSFKQSTNPALILSYAAA